LKHGTRSSLGLLLLLGSMVQVGFCQQTMTNMPFPTNPTNRIRVACPNIPELSVYFGFSGSFKSLHNPALPPSTFEHSADVASYLPEETASDENFDAHKFINSPAPSDMTWTYFSPASETLDLKVDIEDAQGKLISVKAFDASTAEFLGAVNVASPRSRISGTISVPSASDLRVEVLRQNASGQLSAAGKFIVPGGTFQAVYLVPIPVSFKPKTFCHDRSSIADFPIGQLYDLNYCGVPQTAYSQYHLLSEVYVARAGSIKQIENDQSTKYAFGPDQESNSLVKDNCVVYDALENAKCLKFESGLAKAAAIEQLTRWVAEEIVPVCTDKPATAKPYSVAAGIWTHDLTPSGYAVFGVPVKANPDKTWAARLVEAGTNLGVVNVVNGSIVNALLPVAKNLIQSMPDTKADMVFKVGDILHVKASALVNIAEQPLYQDAQLSVQFDKAPPTDMPYRLSFSFADWTKWTHDDLPAGPLLKEVGGTTFSLPPNATGGVVGIQKGKAGKIIPALAWTTPEALLPGQDAVSPYEFTPAFSSLEIPTSKSASFNATLKVLFKLKVYTKAGVSPTNVVNRTITFTLQRQAIIQGVACFQDYLTNISSNQLESIANGPDRHYATIRMLAPGVYRIKMTETAFSEPFTVTADLEQAIEVTRPFVPPSNPPGG